MGKGKPKAKNAFWHYMLYMQNELKKKGQNLAIGDHRLQTVAGDAWKGLSKEEREPWEAKAKAEKERLANQPVQVNFQVRGSFQDNYSRTMSREAEQKNEAEAQEEYYEKLVESCVKACQSREDLLNVSFFIIGSNVMVRTDDNQWPPLEIGICQYSIQNGIQFNYHEFIDAGRVPLGYMHLSKQHMEMTHKIPLQDFAYAINNYAKIVEDISLILDNSRFTNDITGKPTPMLVFCREDALEQNRGIFEWLQNKYAQTYPGFKWEVEVLDLTQLVYHVLNCFGHQMPIAIIEDKLKTSAFDYSANTLCHYHEEIDNRDCAQGLARRLCYMLSQIFCPLLDITPTENHLPPRRENVVAETYMGVLSEVKTMPKNRYHSTYGNDNEWEPMDETPAAAADGQQPERPQSRPLGGIGRGISRTNLAR